MNYSWNKLGQLSAIGAACSLAAWLGTSSAKEEASVLVNKPAAPVEKLQAGPALPPPLNPNENATTTTNDPFVPPLSIPNYTAKKVAVPPQELPPPVVPPQESSPQPKRPFMRPAEPRAPAQGKLVGEETMPMPPGAASSDPAPSVTITQPGTDGLRIRSTPPIDYDTDHDARRMYRTGKIDLIMLTKDPTGDCAYEIPMCIPACCVGDPQIAERRGIFGRGIVEYRWACGFRAIVKFRHVLGDIRVDYEGD
jgi:hypothetical protein